MLCGRTDDVVERVLDDHVIVFPLARRTGDVAHIYSFEGVGAFVWEQLARPQAIGDLVDTVLNEFDVQPQVAAREVEAFVGDLQQAGLVRVQEG